MRARKRGSTPRPIDPRVKQLETENARLQRKLRRAETIVEVQKQIAELLGIPLTPRGSDETDWLRARAANLGFDLVTRATGELVEGAVS